MIQIRHFSSPKHPVILGCLESKALQLKKGLFENAVGPQGCMILAPSQERTLTLKLFSKEINEKENSVLTSVYINADSELAKRDTIGEIVSRILREKGIPVNPPLGLIGQNGAINLALEKHNHRLVLIIDDFQNFYLKDRNLTFLHEALHSVDHFYNSRKGRIALILAGSVELPKLFTMTNIDKLSLSFPLVRQGFPMNLTKASPINFYPYGKHQ